MKTFFMLFLLVGLVLSSASAQTAMIFRFTFDESLTDKVSGDVLLPPATMTPTYVDGKFGKAIQLNGINEYLDFGGPAAAGSTPRPAEYLVDPANESLTACAWVYNTLSEFATLASGYDEEQVIHIRNQRVMLQLSFLPENETDPTRHFIGSWVAGDGGLKAEVAETRNAWHHIAVTTNPVAKTNTFYLDGVSLGAMNDNGKAWSPTGAGYRIGAHQGLGNNAFWHGLLDEVCLFRGQLTDEQIVKVMNQNFEDFETTSRVDKIPVGDKVRIYPNPVKDQIHVEGIENVSEMTLLTLDGRKVLTVGKTSTITISGLASGNYLLKVQLTNGSHGYKKVMVF